MPRALPQRRAYRLRRHRAADTLTPPLGKAIGLVEGGKLQAPGRDDAEVLTAAPPAAVPKSKTLFNGARDGPGLNSLVSGPTALAPSGGGQMAAERTAHAKPFAPNKAGGAVPLSLEAINGICRLLT